MSKIETERFDLDFNSMFGWDDDFSLSKDVSSFVDKLLQEQTEEPSRLGVVYQSKKPSPQGRLYKIKRQ